jgi:hypothetical protein
MRGSGSFSFLAIFIIAVACALIISGCAGNSSSGTSSADDGDDDTSPMDDDTQATDDDTQPTDDDADDDIDDDSVPSTTTTVPTTTTTTTSTFNCCQESDPCGIADNGLCECPGEAWDDQDCDCESGLNIPQYDDPPGIQIGDLYIEVKSPSWPGYNSTSMAVGPGGEKYIVAEAGYMLFLYYQLPGEQWQRELIDRFVSYSDMAIDSGGNLHVAYVGTTMNLGGPGLKYATDESGEWQIEDLNLNAEIYGVTIAADDQGFAHVAVLDEGNTQLYYFTNREGDWTALASPGGAVCANADIAVDRFGKVHMVCSSGDFLGALYYLSDREGDWLAWGLLPFMLNSGQASLVLDDDGKVHIVHYPGIWDLYDPEVYVAYTVLDENFPAPSSLETEFILQEISDWGIYSSIALDGDGFAHIAVQGTYSVRPYYSTNVSGDWQRKALKVCDYDNGDNISLALDANGDAHISHNAGARRLRYASNESGAWGAGTIDYDRYFGSILAISDDGVLHTLIYDREYERYLYGTRVGDNWETEIIGSVAGTFLYSSMALDSLGYAHIVHSNDSEGLISLIYRTNREGTWTSDILEDEVDTFTISGIITVDGENKPHIAYKISDVGLHYAKETELGWEKEFVTADHAATPLLAIDSGGNAHIIHANSQDSERQINHTTNQSGVWQSDYIWPHGQLNSMVLDENGKIHFTNSQTSSPDVVQYVSNESGSWETVLEVEDASYSVLALDEDGHVHLVYNYRSDAGKLQYYTTNMTGSWTHALVGGEGTSSFSMVLDNEGMAHVLTGAYGLRYAKFPQGYTGQ